MLLAFNLVLELNATELTNGNLLRVVDVLGMLKLMVDHILPIIEKDVALPAVIVGLVQMALEVVGFS